MSEDEVGQEDGESVSDVGHGPSIPAPSTTPEESWLGTAETKHVLMFCEDIGAMLGMPAFRYVFAAEPADEEVHASVVISSKRYVAVISVNKEWLTYTTRNKAESLAHEVLHCFMARLDEIWDQACHDMHMPVVVSEQLQRVWVREMELVVDLLTMFVWRTEDLEERWRKIDLGKGELTPPGPS